MSLPETYKSGHHMARVLSSYIDCPSRVRREVLQMFPKAPNAEEVQAMRARYLRERNPAPSKAAWSAHEGYYPMDVSRQAENDNKRFVQALIAARP